MTFISSSPIKRSPMQKTARFLFGTIVVALIIYGISQIPYDILREERFRLFGETHTMGVVKAVREIEGGAPDSRFVIEYRYVDNDGYAHEAVAPLPEKMWKKFRQGSRVEAIYASSRPGLVRVRGEIEPQFQLWLRDILH